MIWALLLGVSISGAAGHAEAGQTGKAAAAGSKAVTVGDFSDRAKAYVTLRKDTEDSFTGLKSSNDPGEIAAHKIELAAMIVAARKNARQGDIFTPKIASQFREIIRKTFREPGAQAVRRTVEDKDPEKSVSVRVNMVYPEDSPLQTMPPTLLGRLPELPGDMAYRIVGSAFVLLDNKTRLIVDYIPDALP
jgi:hypothetical protein